MSKTKQRSEIISNITDWLREEGIAFELKSSPYLDFDLEVEYQTKRYAHIIMDKNKKDSIAIFVRIEFSELDKKAFVKLDENTKKEFLIALSSSLCNMNLPHSVHPQADKMEYLHIEKRIFFDGLSKDRLFDILDRVFNGMGLAYLTYSKYLSQGRDSSASLSSFFF
jgi:hypothetical protein